MEAYRHFDRKADTDGVEFGDKFASGASIKVGLHSYFRSLENGARFDRREGIVTYTIPPDKPWHMIKPTADDIEAAARCGIRIHPDNVHNLSITNGQFTVAVADHYLLCCSDRPDVDMAKRESLRIFHISDVEELAARLAATRPDLFGEPVCKPVLYGNKRVDPRVRIDPGPFAKAGQFRFEHEVRIAWPARSKEPWVAVSADVADLITEVRW